MENSVEKSKTKRKPTRQVVSVAFFVGKSIDRKSFRSKIFAWNARNQRQALLLTDMRPSQHARSPKRGAPGSPPRRCHESELVDIVFLSLSLEEEGIVTARSVIPFSFPQLAS